MSAALAFSRDGDFVITPALLDLVLHLVETAIMCGSDAGDVVPDEAAVVFDRIVVDTDVGRKSSVTICAASVVLIATLPFGSWPERSTAS